MTLGTKEFMGMSHAKFAMQAADMSYRLEQAEKVIAELEKAVEAVEINVEECLDWDDSMAMLVPIDYYHKLIEALASAKAWKEGT